MPNKDFRGIINKALADIQFEGDAKYVAKRFVAEVGYLENNWKENVNGEGYLDNSRLSRRPDLQQRVRDIVTELAPKIDAVEPEFSNKYNWTRNPELNSAYTTTPQDSVKETAAKQVVGASLTPIVNNSGRAVLQDKALVDLGYCDTRLYFFSTLCGKYPPLGG